MGFWSTSKPYRYFFLVRVFDIKSGWVLQNLNRPDRQNMWSYILDCNRPTRDILRSPIASRLQALFISGAPGSLVGLCCHIRKLCKLQPIKAFSILMIANFEACWDLVIRMLALDGYQSIGFVFLFLITPDLPNNHLQKLIIEIHTFFLFQTWAIKILHM